MYKTCSRHYYKLLIFSEIFVETSKVTALETVGAKENTVINKQ